MSEKRTVRDCKVPASFDAKDWVEEFNLMLVRNGNQPYDPETLVGWFANAIMRGFDEGYKRAEAEIQEIRKAEVMTKVEIMQIVADQFEFVKSAVICNKIATALNAEMLKRIGG